MNKYIKLFRQGRKIYKAVLGDNTYNWASYTTNGNTTPTLFSPSTNSGYSPDYRKKREYVGNTLNVDEFLEFMDYNKDRNQSSDNQDPEKAKEWLDKRNRQKQEVQEVEEAPIKINLPTTEDDPKLAPKPVRPKPVRPKPIDWKARNLQGLVKIFGKDYLIGGKGLDYWADPNNFKVLQQNLKKAYYDIGRYGADGKFGDDTEKALRSANKNKGFKGDGTVNPGVYYDSDDITRRWHTYDNDGSPMGYGYMNNMAYMGTRIARVNSDGSLAYTTPIKLKSPTGQYVKGMYWTDPKGQTVAQSLDNTKVYHYFDSNLIDNKAAPHKVSRETYNSLIKRRNKFSKSIKGRVTFFTDSKGIPYINRGGKWIRVTV